MERITSPEGKGVVARVDWEDMEGDQKQWNKEVRRVRKRLAAPWNERQSKTVLYVDGAAVGVLPTDGVDPVEYEDEGDGFF